MLPVIVLTLLLAASVTDAGVSFIRWGRTTCPAGSQALYKGYMAGPHYNAGGNGANYLCMLEKPEFPKSVPGHQGASGYIFGVEFDLIDAYKPLFSTENIPGGQIVEQDMPCVRCYVAGSYDVMVVPGAQHCGGTGYDLMYKGYLVSAAHGQQATAEFVCLDEAPEGIAGGTGNNNQAIIYPVQIGCGSLPCNPYVDGLEVSCAVCTY